MLFNYFAAGLNGYCNKPQQRQALNVMRHAKRPDMKYYRISISTDRTVETYNRISDLLDVQPMEDTFDIGSNNHYSVWTYSKEENENDEGPYFDFINRFLDLLEPRFEQLEKLGIKRSDISFWYLYEYDQQCGMEFHPQEMKRLGESGITLCIDCWQT